MATRVAALGTGIMGAPMASNLARAGLDVVVWNRTAERAQPLEREGATVAGSPAEAVRGAEIVITMLADGDAVGTVMSGADGGLAAMDDDAVWLQTSTVGIEATERLAGLVAERAVEFVDAPVLGTKGPAEQGNLVILVSGPSRARERCRPVFEAIGSRTVELGDAGEGTRLKLVVNQWIVGLVENLAETFGLAEALGLDPALFLESIKGGAMDTPYAQLKGRAILERSFEPSFTLKLARKDVGLVLEAAERHGYDPALARVIAERFDAAIALGHGDEDMCAAYFASASNGRAQR